MHNTAKLRESIDTLIYQRDYVTVAIDNNIAGVFTMNDKVYGFQYELINQFSEFYNKPVKLVYIESNESVAQKVKESEIDFVITSQGCGSDINAEEIHTYASTFEHNYVVLQKKTDLQVDNLSQLRNYVQNGRIVMTKPFTKSKVYDDWTDKVTNSAQVSNEKTEKLVVKLLNGKMETLVCDALQANLALLKYGNKLSVIHSIETDKTSSIYIGKGKNNLKSSFLSWYFQFSATSTYTKMDNIYKSENLYLLAYNYGYKKQLDKYLLSPYDHIFQEVANKNGKDWRFLSAIAYNESRFNTNAVSNRGAMGIMQIMPSTAEDFNSHADKMYEPDENIAVAVELIKSIEKSLKFSAETSEYDKKCLILAAYNCGIGHVLDARRLAKKHNLDYNDWTVISEYLALKSTKEYVNDESVKRGSCKSEETIAFVSNVMSKYSQYVSYVELNEKNNNKKLLSQLKTAK